MSAFKDRKSAPRRGKRSARRFLVSKQIRLADRLRFQNAPIDADAHRWKFASSTEVSDRISKVAAKSQLSRPRCARLGESFDTGGRATASAAPGVEGWSACARPARNPTVRRFTSAREGREGRARPQGERARPDCGRCSAPARRRGHRIWRVQTGDSRGKASMGGGSGVSGGAGTANSPPPFKANPMHIKYRAYTTGDDPNVDLKVRAVCQAARSRVLPSARRTRGPRGGISAARDRL